MVVVILIDVAPGLRGHLTRWMVELRPGVFVGTPSKRIRDRFWNVLCDRIGTGSAIMVEPSNNEQGWLARTAGTDRWHPVDFDGLQLMARPRSDVNATDNNTVKSMNIKHHRNHPTDRV